MPVVRVDEAEALRDFAAVWERVQGGAEVTIERNHRPVPLVKPSKAPGRLISEILADLRAQGSDAVMDEELARDIQAGINESRQPWNPSWDS